MDTLTFASFSDSLTYISAQTVAGISLFLPRLLAALLVFLVGAAIAKLIRRLLIQLLEALMVSQLLKNTPIEHFVTNTEVGRKIEEIVGGIAYWLIMLVVLHSVVSILGLAPVSAVLDRILAYIPQVFSAVIVLFFGLLLAGVVESVVKGAIKSIDGHAARLLSKVASYLVVAISVLVAISELGIAEEFILILFVGLVAMLALGFGLALGLGGQDMVRELLKEYGKSWKARR